MEIKKISLEITQDQNGKHNVFILVENFIDQQNALILLKNIVDRVICSEIKKAPIARRLTND